jgi:16S rRNA (uracil1498-N3)-methyltransferase
MLALAGESEFKVAFWEKAVAPIPIAVSEQGGGPFRTAFILLGPEGGLTAGEMGYAEAAGFTAATLGPRILRAETATLAPCGLIQ